MTPSPGADLATRRRLIALLLLRGQLATLRAGEPQAAQSAVEDRAAAPGAPPPSGKDPA
jgi:hypothetical protein